MTNKEFNQIFNQLEDDDKIILRIKTQKACGVSYDVFYNWLCGRTKLPNWAAKEITNILNDLANE